MVSKVFVPGTVVDSPWLNDVNGDVYGVQAFRAPGDSWMTAFQKSVDSFGDLARVPFSLSGHGYIWVPRLVYDMTGTLQINKKNLKITGANSILKWAGSAGTPAIRIYDSSRCKLTDLILLGDFTTPPSAAIFFDNPVGSTVGTNEAHVVEDVIIGRRFLTDTTTGGSSDATPYGRFTAGIVVGGAVDGNNDEYHINRVQVHGVDTNGFDFQNTQSIWSSLTDCLANDCKQIGFRIGCSIVMRNPTANRNVVCDILGIRQLQAEIFEFNAENSLIFIRSQSGASFYVKGGKLLRNSAVPSNFFRWESGGDMVLEDLVVDNPGGTGDTIFYRNGSLATGRVYVRNCTIKGGNLRDTWDIDTGNVMQATIDIEHGKFKFYTTRTYLDRAGTFGSIAPEARALVASGSATLSTTSFFNASFSKPLQGQHLSVSPENAGQIRAGIYNPTAGALDLGAGRVRWMDLGDNTVINSFATIDLPSIANGAGTTSTVSLPGVKLGDFVTWTCTTNAVVTLAAAAYVSADNTVAIRFHNATGGSVNPPSGVFGVAKLSEFGTFFGSAAYTPSAIATGTSVTVTATVPGAQIGAHVFAAYTADLQGLLCTASVSATDTVEIVLSNYTGGPITLAAGGFNVMAAF